MKLLICFFYLSFFTVIETIAQNRTASVTMESGKGIKFTSADSLFTLSLGGRIQTMFEGRYNQDNKTTSGDFILRRSRLNFQGTAFDPRFTYRIQIGFAQGDITAANSEVQNNLVLRDAMLFYQAKHWLRLGFGQTKLPGNRQRQVSSANLQLVERSIANNNFTLDRDKGFWAYTNFDFGKSVLKATAAVSSGEGRIASNKNGKLSFASRVEFLPLGDFTSKGDFIEGDVEKEKKPKLSLAAVYSTNDRATRTMGQLGEFLFNSTQTDINYFGGDLLFKHNGFSIQSELYNRSSSSGIIINAKDSTQKNAIIQGTAFVIQSGYFVSKRNEIAVRYASIDPKAAVAAVVKSQREFVIGGSHYFAKHALKIQSDVTLYKNEAQKEYVYRLSCVLSF